MIDSRDLNDLEPALRRGAQELNRRLAAKGLPMLVTSTYRDYAMQDYLYEQGRTRPGSIITNAKGGYSYHNFRLAFDICKNIRGSEYADAAFFSTAGAEWRNMGGAWGGDFTTIKDTPHFEFTSGLTTAQLRAGAKMPADTKMKWEAEAAAPTSPPPPQEPPVLGNKELIGELAKFIQIDPNYWVGALEGKTAVNPEYALILFERLAEKSPEKPKRRAEFAVAALGDIIQLDPNYWTPAIRGERPIDAGYLKTLLARAAEALGKMK